ncbi:SDR family oxidoreductase [Arthrobacter sp. TMT4-20]
MTETILVYGATGTQGTPVEDQLLTQGRTTRVVTRDANRAAHWSARGAEVAVADLGDPDSLAKANAGRDRAVLQLPLQYDFELHEAYGRNAVDSAGAAGVKLVVFNTSAHVIPGENVHAYEAHSGRSRPA